MPRYNKVTNPSCDNNVSGWNAYTSTGAPSAAATQVTSGVSVAGKTRAGRITVNGSYAAGFSVGGASAGNGQVWTYVLWVRVSATRQVSHGISKLNGTSLVSTSNTVSAGTIAANTWTQLRQVVTVPTGGTWNRLCVHLDFPNAVSSTVDVAAVRMEQISDSTLTFADGSTGGQWSWDGTAGSSSSTMSDTVAITVRNALSASSAPVATLAQRSAAALLSARSETRAGTALVVQRHPVVAAGARSAAAASRPVLTQRHALVVRSARAVADVIGVATATDGTGYGQGGYGSTPYGGTAGAVSDGRPTLVQRSSVALRDARSLTAATAPEVIPRGLSMRNIRSASSATRPALTQRQTVTVSAARAATRAPAVSLAQAHSPLVLRGARSESAASRPALTQRHGLVVLEARSTSAATRPLLAQATALVVRGARSTAAVVRALVAHRTALLVRGATVTTQATRPVLAQRSVLSLRGARAAAFATRSTPAFRLGTQVRTPTTVVLVVRSESLLLEERRGDPAVRSRSGSVVVNTRGRIRVADRHGTVVEMPP